jgi:hypothetical protein
MDVMLQAFLNRFVEGTAELPLDGIGVEIDYERNVRLSLAEEV